MAALAQRINRAKAEAMLKGVLDRIVAINADPDMMHYLTEMRVLGSYLNDTDDLGDLDLALSYELRPTSGNVDDTKDLKAFTDAIEAFARKHGKEHLGWQEKPRLPERVLRQRIVGRSPYISLHDMRELNQNPQFGGKTIYTFNQQARRS
jgi:hypothetical protein